MIANTSLPDKCPNCGAPVKRASRRDLSKSYVYFTSVQFSCGSSASLHWAPPLFYCGSYAPKQNLTIANSSTTL